MCIYKKEIQPKYWRQKIFVSCGRCPACLQEKANKRSRRIVNHDPLKKLDCLFVTLTYKNEFVPYFKENDLFDLAEGKIECLPIYRDKSVRRFFNRHIGQYKEIVHSNSKPLFEYSNLDFLKRGLDQSDLNIYLKHVYKYLRKSGNRFVDVEAGKIGVCYYKDVQDFNKRLRSYIDRNVNFPDGFKYSFFACTEYGPSSSRPHLHLLMYIPKGYFALFKRAIVQSWLFDDIRRRSENIEKAYAPASYVSSYVNSSDFVKGILKGFKPFKMRHVYSEDFGFGKKEFSFLSVFDAFRKGNLTTIETISRNGCLTSLALPYPKYVINKYFPKFKGFVNLSVDEMRDVIIHPQHLSYYSDKTQQSEREQVGIYKKLLNLRKTYCKEFSVVDYALVYSQIWSLLFSAQIKFNSDNFMSNEQFDNLKDLQMDKVSYTEFVLPSEIDVFDPNLFQSNLLRDSKLRVQYFEHSKQKKANNTLYKEFNHV